MASSTWLQAAISVAFVGEGVWRLVASGRMTSAPEKATAIFNFVNFLLFGLLGLSCVCWPVVSTWFDNKPEYEASDSSISTRLIQTDVGVADEDPLAAAPARAPEPKRKITYLTNLTNLHLPHLHRRRSPLCGSVVQLECWWHRHAGL